MIALWRRPSSGVRAPLVVLLHGRGADEEDLIGVTDRLPRRFAFASLRAPHAVDGGGYTWFESSGVARPVGASLQASVRDVRAWLETEARAYGRCFLLGFSAGMMMAGALILDDPEAFAGAVLLSGALALNAGSQAPPGRLTEMPVFFGHGTLDRVIPAALVDETSRYLREQSGADLTVREYPHAHAISDRELDDIGAWFERYA